MSHTMVLVRHGQSEWNEKNLFTGWYDAGLTRRGEDEARIAGQMLREAGLEFDVLFTSLLQRATRTGQMILDELGQSDLETIRVQEINERDYGDLVGLNKDEARTKWGAEKVHQWRRSFDIAPPGGESLKDTVARIKPYYESTIRPRLLAGETVLIAAHGNSLRALIMGLENIAPEDITAYELWTGVPIIYQFNDSGKLLSKQILKHKDRV